jgi:hypothetical protein
MLPTWTPELTRRAWSMYLEGMSGRQIASSLELTRGTVMGKLHREKIRRGYEPRPRGSRLLKIKRRPSVSRSGPQIMSAIAARRRAERRVHSGTQRSEGGVPLLDLRDGECRWPMDDAGTLFCSAPALPERSYCETHHARGTVRPRDPSATTPFYRR